VLHEFTGPDGSDPQGGLTVDPNTGTLYGTAIYGGAGYGTVFSLTPPPPGKSRWKFKVIYTFQGGTNGSQPTNGLLFLSDDAGQHLIGTTLRGSSFCDCGTIFELDNVSGDWEKIASHQFQGDTYDGGLPNSTPVFDPKTKTVFGTTGSSGNDSGSIYGLDPANFDFTVIYNPAQHIGTPVGTSPFGVVVDSDEGLLFGTALKSDYAGTIFLMDFQGEGEILHQFKGPPDGAYPGASPTMDASGTLYGSTFAGGNPKACPNSPGCGIIWKKPPSSREKVVHSMAFYSHPRDGQSPISPLVLDAENYTLYGTTYYGGTGTICGGYNGSCGTIFSVDTSGDNYQVLWGFPRGGPASPQGQLVFHDGALYGSSYDGGTSCPDRNYIGCGTVWKLTP
jgi:hypothetical protein